MLCGNVRYLPVIRPQNSDGLKDFVDQDGREVFFGRRGLLMLRLGLSPGRHPHFLMIIGSLARLAVLSASSHALTRWAVISSTSFIYGCPARPGLLHGTKKFVLVWLGSLGVSVFCAGYQ